MSEADLRAFCDLVVKMEKGLIERGESRFVSTTIILKKKANEMRCVMDVRETNRRTKFQSSKMPCFEEILTLMGKGKYTTINYVNNEFGSIPIAESSRKYAGIHNPPGIYRYRTGAYGVSSFPFTLCKLM